MHWIWLIIVGALVGALGRLFHPGSDPMGWIVTILLGIASLVVAGLIFSAASGSSSSESSSPSSSSPSSGASSGTGGAAC